LREQGKNPKRSKKKTVQERFSAGGRSIGQYKGMSGSASKLSRGPPSLNGDIIKKSSVPSREIKKERGKSKGKDQEELTLRGGTRPPKRLPTTSRAVGT